MARRLNSPHELARQNKKKTFFAGYKGNKTQRRKKIVHLKKQRIEPLTQTIPHSRKVPTTMCVQND